MTLSSILIKTDSAITNKTGQDIFDLITEKITEILTVYITQVKTDPQIYRDLQKNLKLQYSQEDKKYKETVQGAMELLILNLKKYIINPYHKKKRNLRKRKRKRKN